MLLNGKRIFIVEDNAGNLAIMQTILDQHGAKIFFERWGRNTCERLRAALPIDLILLDLMLPDGVTGYQVFDAIQAFPDLAQIPVVLVSAADVGEERETAMSKGLKGFISKPIRVTTFARFIVEAIEGKQVWG
jgi:adenylate cyclase